VELRTETNHDAVTVVTVSGDIDMSTAPDLDDHLTELSDGGSRDIIVDLGKVDFLDSSALGALVGVHKHIAAAGGSLKLVCSHPKIERIFAITRLTEVIPVFLTLDEAQAAS
jgi:anti-sigma B factor antagonist